ncbi:hypothetical protein [Ruania zhangjianzhongii]|uniref:hypothetical protein n=1 Tax=Ruania zhangjianzhongii TaxID=2603206 RepID=UPI0011CBAFB3|nr:hypothetical protein [Ruania zhangjianzhongii]
MAPRLPADQLDEWASVGEWLIGRVGSGYLAVATPGGFRPVRAGDQAWQEWTPEQDGRAWACLVGDVDRDGTFAEFAATVEATEVVWTAERDNPGVRVVRSGRPVLAVEFDGLFTIDGAPGGLDGEGRPEEPGQWENPAMTAAFGADRAQVAWGGAEHDLDVGAALRMLGDSGR